MRKLFLGMLLVIVCCCPAFAIDSMTASGVYSADALAQPGPGYFYGIALTTDGTNAVTVSVYDNATTNSGKLIIPTFVATTSATDRVKSFFLFPAARYENGV
ncbi:MAG: hypothetical protein WC476_13105, partial [Phycisphaerae bacterium]